MEIGIDVWFVSENDDLDRGVVLLELDEFVVTSSHCRLVRSFGDENDEEISNVLSMYWLLVHRLFGIDSIGSDESEPSEETIRDREHPNESPQSRKGNRVVSPLTSRMVDNPYGGKTGNEEEMRKPCPRLKSQKPIGSNSFFIPTEVGRPSSRMKLRENLGIGRLRDSRSSRRRTPVHEGMEIRASGVIFVGSSVDDRSIGVSGTINDSCSQSTNELERESGCVVWFRDE